MEAALLAEFRADEVGRVVANDAARGSFAVVADGRLVALSGEDLGVLGTWAAPDDPGGLHAVRPADGVALAAAADRVALLDRAGAVRWSFGHPPWGSAGFDAGCAWFDASGRPFALVPADGYEAAVVVALDPVTGNAVSRVHVATAPAGVEPVHHPDGWVGLSVGEGQDAALAWWVCAGDDGAIQLQEADWTDWVLADVDGSGDRILTTPHVEGPLTIRSFPALAVEREIDPPGGDFWDFAACFVGDHVVARLVEGERAVAIPPGQTHPLDAGPGSLVPAAAGSWLTVEETAIRRWALR